MENKEELSNKQKLICYTITSLGMIEVYANGISLAKKIPTYHNHIFFGTIIISFISPYLLRIPTVYLLRKYNVNKKNKQLKK